MLLFDRELGWTFTVWIGTFFGPILIVAGALGIGTGESYGVFCLLVGLFVSVVCIPGAVIRIVREVRRRKNETGRHPEG
jgi:hypothetical protein